MWKGITTDVPFNAEYSDDVIGELYEAEDARAQTFAAFALLAVIVACLGLFGLAACTAERPTRELGIRQVMGARSRDIVRRIAWQFSKTGLLAHTTPWQVASWETGVWPKTA